jgi:hypothetical protein
MDTDLQIGQPVGVTIWRLTERGHFLGHKASLPVCRAGSGEGILA